MKNNPVSDSVTIVALPDQEYRGLWNGRTVVVPFDNYPNTEFNYEFQTYDICPTISPCLIRVADYNAVVTILPDANFYGEIVDGKFIFHNI